MYSKQPRARIAVSCLLSILMTISGIQFAQAQMIDFIAPNVEHRPSEEKVKPGEPVLVTANVTDDARVTSVTLHVRDKGKRDFTPLAMINLDGSSHYEVSIRNTTGVTAIEYFFEATDSSGNTLEMYGSDGLPFRVDVAEGPKAASAAKRFSETDGSLAEVPASASTNRSVLPIKKKSSSSGNRWMWVGLGVLAAAVVAGLGGGGSGGPDSVDDTSPGNTGDLDIDTDVPTAYR